MKITIAQYEAMAFLFSAFETFGTVNQAPSARRVFLGWYHAGGQAIGRIRPSTIDTLEKLGLIEKHPSYNGLMSRAIRLTEKGKNMKGKLGLNGK